METVAIGDLVTVTGPGAPADALVFETPSASKTVIAVVDPRRGPVFRTVDAKTLTAREQPGKHDQALRLLIRRTPGTVRGAASASGASGKGAAGFTRGASHRPTGR